jgi:uncharacterized protein
MIYQITVPQFIKVLNNLTQILDMAAMQAENKKYEMEVLLNSRLAPDQFNLIRQVQIACDSAKLCLSKVMGKEAPVFEDNEKTLPELKQRIEKTIEYLKTADPNEMNEFQSIKITNPRWEGKYLWPQEYVFEYAIPNFYFHITTAYSILRNNGIDIGKKNYLGELPFKK